MRGNHTPRPSAEVSTWLREMEEKVGTFHCTGADVVENVEAEQVSQTAQI